MLHCKSCGTILSLDDLFCGQCGHVVDETKEVTNSRNYHRGNFHIPVTPPPLKPSNPWLVNGEQSQWGPATPPPLRQSSNPRLLGGGPDEQIPYRGTTESSERTWLRPDMEEYYPTIISGKEQVVDRPVPTLPMAPDPLSMRNSSPSGQSTYRFTPQPAPPVTPTPELGNSAAWSWSAPARTPQVQPVPPHSSMPPNAMWPPKPPPSFFHKHMRKLVVIAVASILIISSITVFFLRPRSSVVLPPVVLPPAQLMVSSTILDFGKLPRGVKVVRTIEISNTGGQHLSWTIDTGSNPWLAVQRRTATIDRGSPQQSDNVTVDTSHMPLGSNSAQLLIHSNGGKAAVMVKVVVISPSTKKPLLNLSTSSFNLGRLAAGTQMALSETVSNIGTQPLSWKANPSTVGWLGVYNANGTIPFGGQPETINMVVNTSGLTAGLHQTMLNITSNGGNQKVLISLAVPSLLTPTQPTVTQPPVTQPTVTQPTVTPSPTVPPPLLNVSSTSFGFGQVTVNTQATQRLTLSNSGGMPFTWNANSDHSWLTVRPSTGTIAASSQQTVSVVVNTGQLTPNTYAGNLSITSGGGDTTIAVTVTVVSPPQLCNPNPASGSTLDFGSVQQGQSSPPSQSLTFSNCGGQLLNWTASTQNTAWVSLSSSSGSVNPNQQGSVQVTVDPNQLQLGLQSATLVISSNDPNSNDTVSITISVTGTAPPTPIPSPTVVPTLTPSPTP